MVLKETNLQILDNSGVKAGLCIHVYGKKVGGFGDEILITVKRARASSKLKKGNIYSGVIVRLSRYVSYKNGQKLKSKENEIVLLKKGTKLPIARRVKGKVYLPLKRLGYSRLVLSSPGVL